MKTQIDGRPASTQEKATRINLAKKFYGTFAEIGAGQEVARWFFVVGGASGALAKTISAYDMAVSDAIYGKDKRYVSQARLRKMLDYEFDLMVERLGAGRGDKPLSSPSPIPSPPGATRGIMNATAGWGSSSRLSPKGHRPRSSST